jgi:hypothetical protein
MIKKHLIIGFIFSLVFAPIVNADTDNGSAVWAAYVGNIKLNNNLRAFFDLQPRFNLDSSKSGKDGEPQTTVIRGAVGYQLDPNFSVYLGYAFVPTYSPKKVEQRIFQDLTSVHHHQDLKLSNRLRLEQRNLEGVERISWRARFQSRIQKSVEICDGLGLVLSEEAFFNINDLRTSATQGFEQNRLFLGFNYQISNKLALDVGYLNQYQERRSPNSDSLNNVLFVGLVSSIDLTS